MQWLKDLLQTLDLMLFFRFLRSVTDCTEVLDWRTLVAHKDKVVEVNHMRWIKPSIRNSISALLGSELRKDSPESIEPVRQAMLEVLGEDGAVINPQLTRRLKYLHDVHALWFARAEMVAVLSKLHGEVEAVERVMSLTPSFQGLLPKSLMESARIRR